MRQPLQARPTEPPTSKTGGSTVKKPRRYVTGGAPERPPYDIGAICYA